MVVFRGLVITAVVLAIRYLAGGGSHHNRVGGGSAPAGDEVGVDKWVDGRTARKVTMAVVTKGIHVGVHDLIIAIEAVKATVAELAKSAR